MYEVEVPGASHIAIHFHPNSATEMYDPVKIYTKNPEAEGGPDESSLVGSFFGGYNGTVKNFPGVGSGPLVVPRCSKVWVLFTSDGSNVDWGFRLAAVPCAAPVDPWEAMLELNPDAATCESEHPVCALFTFFFLFTRG